MSDLKLMTKHTYVSQQTMCRGESITMVTVLHIGWESILVFVMYFVFYQQYFLIDMKCNIFPVQCVSSFHYHGIAGNGAEVTCLCVSLLTKLLVLTFCKCGQLLPTQLPCCFARLVLCCEVYKVEGCILTPLMPKTAEMGHPVPTKDLSIAKSKQGYMLQVTPTHLTLSAHFRSPRAGNDFHSKLL